MLISNLGQTRMKLLNSFNDLNDQQLNQKPEENWSIAQILHHVYTTEKENARLVLDALEAKSEVVGEKDLSVLAGMSEKIHTTAPSDKFFTKNELIRLLEESRFQHLQYIFNETHERTLAAKSMNHPVFGLLSLKNVVDTIWLHDKQSIEQIQNIRQKLGF